MAMQYWFVDFDDTLLKGFDMLAMSRIFPHFIQKHGLDFDAEKLNQAIMVAQSTAADNPDEQILLKGIFETMGWPDKLTDEFWQALLAQYQPELFEDALPFLKRLQQQNKTVYILSNNPRTPKRVEDFGLLPYVEAVLTPDTLSGARKPDAALWNALTLICPDLKKESTVIVGDDPWSEGLFAEACGLQCWIVDRTYRYRTLHSTKNYQWVHSLDNIDLD